MALKLDDDQDKRELYDDNQPAWREPYDELEALYNSPSATTDNLTDKHPEKKGFYKPEELSEAEQADNTSTTKDAESRAVDQLGEGYSEEGRKRGGSRFLGNLSRRQKIIGGGATGGLIGGSIFFFTFIQGPLQIIHLSELLQKFHFAKVEDTGTNRTVQLYKFARNGRAGTLQNMRLGAIEQRIATKIDLKLEEIGIKKAYLDGPGAVFDGATLDAKQFSEKAADGKQFRRLDSDDFMTKFKQEFDIDLTSNGDGTFKIPREGGWLKGWHNNRKFNRVLMGQVGYEGLGGRMLARIMAKRDGITLHPIKKADAKIIDSVDKWLTRQKERIRGGSSDLTVSADGEKVEDADGNLVDDPNNASAAQAADDAATAAAQAADDVDLTPSSGSSDGLLRRFTGSTTGRLTMGITAVTGLVCTVKALSDNADALKHNMVIQPLIRMGVEAISLGQQLKSPEDLDMRLVSYYAKQLSDEEGVSWVNAMQIQAEQGQPMTGEDIPDEANVGKIKAGTPFSRFLDLIPGIDGICGAVNSVFGQVINLGISLFTPISAGLTLALMQTPAARDATASVVRWMAGSPIPTVVFGPVFGNFVNTGAKLAKNDTMAAMAGRKLSAEESGAIRANQLAFEREELQNRPLLEKLFNPYSPDSAIAKLIDNSSTNIGTNVASLFSGFGNMLSSLGSLFSQKVGAQAADCNLVANPSCEYDYGFEDVGFSLSELQDPRYEDPYANAEAVYAYLQDLDEDEAAAVSDRTEQCFGVRIAHDATLTTLFTSIDTTAKDYPDDCADQSSEWTAIRMYIVDNKTAEAIDCYENSDSTSCEQIGFGADTPATPAANPAGAFKGEDTSLMTCTVGTDAGVADTPDPTKKVRLCTVGGVTVNVAIAPNLQAILEGGAAAGLTYSGSGYRSNLSQISLRERNGCAGRVYDRSCPGTPLTAVPGRSMHEWGLAIDLRCDGSLIQRQGTPCFDWLRNNQGLHNLINLPAEPWHWSSSGG